MNSHKDSLPARLRLKRRNTSVKKAASSFVLPTNILLNQQDKALRFQQQWLSLYSVERVVNLSDMSHLPLR